MKIFKRNINLGRKVPVIDTPDLRDKCVTTDKLADGSVTTNKIADGAITREKIADKAITNLDNVVQEAQETADHPTYVGEDNYVYAWNRITKTYDKTSIYVRGEGFHVSKTFDSVADMEAYTGTDLKEGDFVLIQSTPDDPDNAKLYTFSGTQGIYNYLVNMSGAIGFTGQTPQFSIGSIITIEPTEQASASLSPDGTDSDGNPKYKLNLALPKGEKGTSDFVIVDDHSGAGDDPNKIYIPSANAEKENAIAIANEVTRATEAEQTNATAIATEEARARAAELENATAIANEVTRAKAAEQANVTAIGGIEEKIPTQATAQNKLADKDFVNSSISTATADFKGTYNNLADLQAVVGANANDYGFVVTTDAAGNTVYKKYKYVTGTGWAFEYVLNNSSFTAEQWATIQSGMTAALTSKLADLPTNTALQDALTTIRESVAAEGTRARAAEKENATAIANEVTRATEAEQTNATAIAAEEARARAAEQTNATAIATEEARARAAEQTNATAIATEEARARAAEADRYTKSETYTKTEINGLVDTPHQEYVTVDAYSNLPSTGSKDTIYRVSNYNGSTSQVDITSYSEYAWNGSSYTFLCVKSQIGEVFDISVYNNNAKYADLAAALNGGTNIPQFLQKGGMSVKFIQSSDNKYVQYFLTKDEWSIDPNDWEKMNLEGEIKHLDNKLIKISGFGTLSTFNVTEVGQVFYHTANKNLMRVISIHTPITPQDFEIVPFEEAAIYTYNNQLYVWNGYNLILTVNEIILDEGEIKKRITSISYINGIYKQQTDTSISNVQYSELCAVEIPAYGGMVCELKLMMNPPTSVYRSYFIFAINDTTAAIDQSEIGNYVEIIDSVNHIFRLTCPQGTTKIFSACHIEEQDDIYANEIVTIREQNLDAELQNKIDNPDIKAKNIDGSEQEIDEQEITDISFIDGGAYKQQTGTSISTIQTQYTLSTIVIPVGDEKEIYLKLMMNPSSSNYRSYFIFAINDTTAAIDSDDIANYVELIDADSFLYKLTIPANTIKIFSTCYTEEKSSIKAYVVITKKELEWLTVKEKNLDKDLRDKINQGNSKHYRLWDSIKKPINFSGKKIVAFGDSITYGVASPGLINAGNNKYISKFCDMVGAQLYSNNAVSGSCIADPTDSPLSIRGKVLSYTGEADIIWIAGGTNDWNSGKIVGTYGSTDVSTTYGALKSICDYITNNYPNAVVIFITPIPYTLPDTDFPNHIDALDAYRTAIYDVATAYGFSVVDGSHIGMPQETGGWNDIMCAPTDGCHPTVEGHKLMARGLTGKLL